MLKQMPKEIVMTKVLVTADVSRDMTRDTRDMRSDTNRGPL
jgi:hypothetical protein